MDWEELTRLTKGGQFRVERVRVDDSGAVIEGDFEPPPLAQLTPEDQVFVVAFVRAHGSIKEMERLFGISYPTVKNRINRIAEQLEFVDVNPPAPRTEVLDRLERGEINVDEAIEQLKGGERS
jgi:hypothetical protein